MKIFLAALMALTITGCSSPEAPTSEIKAGGNRTGNLRGYQAINSTIRQRVFDTGEDNQGARFDLTFFAPGLGNLVRFLGGFDGQAAESRFQNGEPNAVNMMLWNIIMTNLSNQLGSLCTAEGNAIDLPPVNGGFPPNQQLIVAEEVAADIKTGCTVDPATATGEDLLPFWFAVMGFEASEESFKEWRAAFYAPELSELTPEQRVSESLKGIFLNPVFLLEK